jgi:hypothetical protein
MYQSISLNVDNYNSSLLSFFFLLLLRCFIFFKGLKKLTMNCLYFFFFGVAMFMITSDILASVSPLSFNALKFKYRSGVDMGFEKRNDCTSRQLLLMTDSSHLFLHIPSLTTSYQAGCIWIQDKKYNQDIGALKYSF